MNFKEAYEKMREGKKVKRKGHGMCCVYDSKENKFCTGDGVAVTGIAFEAALADDWEIVEEPVKDWKPKKGDKYYYIGSAGSIFNYDCREDILDVAHRNIGNYFKTGEEAKHMVEKLKVIKELRDFALENNDKNVDWRDKYTGKYFITYDFYDEEISIASYTFRNFLPFAIYFTSKEIAQKAIKTIGKYRIKKYYFDIEE